jgi:hypothetical protein
MPGPQLEVILVEIVERLSAKVRARLSDSAFSKKRKHSNGELR